jgi:Ca-activated chloride channel family protein
MKQYRHSILGMGIAEVLFWVVVGATLLVLGEFAPHLEWNKSEWALILAALPISTLAFFIHLKWKVKAVEKLAETHLVDGVVEGFSAGRSAWRFIIWRLAIAFAMLGVLGPKVGSKLVEIESKGSDIVVAIDVSNSMMAEDLGSSRLTVAHQTVERLLSKLGTDRVALVVFAGEAYVQCPLTSDYSALKIFLNSVNPDIVSTQGTALGSAIDVSLNAFENAPENGRSILILTDGENHEDDPVAAAARANDEGVTVHILGLATPEGGPIPKFNNRGKKVGFIEDTDGRPVVSKLDESALTATASAGGGIFTRAKRSFIDINPILDEFKKSLKTKSTDIRFTDYDHKFQFFILLSIFFLLIEAIIPNPASKS